MTTKTQTKHAKPAPKHAPVDYTAVIKQMRSDIFMVCYRMQATVQDALVAQKAGLRELAQGHLEEMKRILENTMDRYR